MNLDHDCIECLINQSRRVADAVNADPKLRERLVQTVTQMCAQMRMDQSPPEAAADLYAAMSELAGKHDLYDEVKAHSSRRAEAFVPELRRSIAEASDPLLAAIKTAVAGNVIDLAAEVSFDLHDELSTVFDTPFAVDDFDRLHQAIESAESLLYIADNVGEHLFDFLCIETLRRLYPTLSITYMVRGAPIINDVTMAEAEAAGFAQLCALLDSGVDTPGFVYGRAGAAAREAFDTADVVLTKGMGNYECLSPAGRDNLFYLLKVKCRVVARSLAAEVGDLVCKRV